jgi:fused signal recognition particle receptor
MLPLLVAAVAVSLVVIAVLFVRSRSRPRAATIPPPPTPRRGAGPPRVQADGLGAKVRALFGGGTPGEDEWSRLEALLVRADVGPATSARMVIDVRERWAEGVDPEELLKEEVVSLLGADPGLDLPKGRLSVVLVVGVNGSGKTTTIGKLAAWLTKSGRKVGLAGSDTFRAAASEQLEVWAGRAGATLVSQDRGADPGAVAFDAVKSATARGTDVLIVDTAGRLHTRTPLMDELKKVKRVIEKAGGTIDETLLVLDATTGQNGIAQARAFTDAVEVTGVALTKLDGTAKGGIVFAVREELGMPVKLVGTGEGVDDLEAFDAASFAERMLRG